MLPQFWLFQFLLPLTFVAICMILYWQIGENQVRRGLARRFRFVLFVSAAISMSLSKFIAEAYDWWFIYPTIFMSIMFLCCAAYWLYVRFIDR